MRSPLSRPLSFLASAMVFIVATRLHLPAAVVTYDAVDALFSKHCLECHGAKDPEGSLVMESHAAVLKGGESGPAIVPGKSSDSLLIRAVEGTWEKDGKKKVMPPGKKKKLEPSEIAVLKQWIDAGAPSTLSGKPRELVVPKISPLSPPRNAIQALAFTGSGSLLAAARHSEVEIRSTASGETVRFLSGHRGHVNALAFSKDGQTLISVGGQPGVSGDIFVWKVSDGSLTRKIEAHRDAIYSVAISPDGTLAATGSYDQEILLWRLSDGSQVRALHGHNGAVFDLAFRPDGQVLASASGDRTVKLWEVTTGKRLDTLSQSTKDLYTLTWNAEGNRLFAAGIDNRIRVWSVSASAQETTNPLLDSRYAHEGSILRLVASADGHSLASSAEDRSVKVWDTALLEEKVQLASQPDLAPGLAFIGTGTNETLAIGRLDGSLEMRRITKEPMKPVTPPELESMSPRGVRRGTATALTVRGKWLLSATGIQSMERRINARWLPGGSETERNIEVTPDPRLPRGNYTLTAVNPGGTSKPVELWVDDIAQRYEAMTNQSPAESALTLPLAWWGNLQKPGEKQSLWIQCVAGESLVLDMAAKSAGSKLNARVELFGPDGLLVGTASPLDASDPFLVHHVSKSGPHRVEVQDEALAGSAQHHFRLSIGSFPFVVGVFPPGVAMGRSNQVTWIGHNLPPNSTTSVTALEPGRIAVPLDPDRCRYRSLPEVIASELPGVIESEPNDVPGQAVTVPVPGEAMGQLWRTNGSGDVDHFAFSARAGETLIVETYAAQQGSPADTRLEILFPDGRPVPRVLLQGRRNTAINFRSVDAIGTGMRLDHYEEMELNEFLYIGGDVMKLFRMPQGPDSDMIMYSKKGKRRAFYGTTATGHALDETGFIVSEHPPVTPPANNGLPAFTVHFENDDDSDRQLGSDSRVFFTPPAAGRYIVKVSEALGRSGERFSYRLILRPPHPDFSITLEGVNPNITPGNGQLITVKAERMDGFEGSIRVSASGLPPGFAMSSPLIIEAGHDSAEGVVYARSDAAQPSAEANGKSQVTAEADIDGRLLITAVNPLGNIRRNDTPPKVLVFLEPMTPATTNNSTVGSVISIAPGQTVSAKLRIERRAFDDVINFEINNLPHGVIVDNLGLNGITFLKGETERELFLTASKWVKPMERPIYALLNQLDRPCSPPITLKIGPAVPSSATR